MIAVIDTSSLISLVRYYLPFDRQNILYDVIKEKIESKQIIVLDKVFDECRYTSQGIVVKRLEYLDDKKNQTKTTSLLPTQKYFNQLENQFINGSVKNLLSPTEFENRKNAFLESADSNLLLFCQTNKVDYTLVTEETTASNDGKSFKKLPALCQILGINIISLPDLLGGFEEINFEFK